MAKKNTFNLSEKMGGAMFSQMTDKPEEPNIDILNDTSKEQITGERVTKIKRTKIVKSPRNEIVYDVRELDALAKDISERGIQQPLLLRQRPDGQYVITSGHRRYAANDMAIEKYGYDGEYIPCIIRDNIADSIEEREALILDNLQRDKTDFNRMMEIVEMRQCAEERRERGETIVNIRQYLMERLGVSNSEISRFEKIHSSLIPELMTLFRAERIATNVAHEIAKLDEPAQKYIYNNWDSSDENETLAFPIMSRLLAQYQISLTAPAGNEAPRPRQSAGNTVKRFSSVSEGAAGIEECCKNVLSDIRDAGSIKDEKREKLILRRINKLYSELLALQDELKLLSADSDNGSREG
ncbi:MAG: ParB N-terminal domain-containing protein [Oscillospiraceae bacterium]|nr:ParB N-terminal domain-containing protein [Oscillospiraceae bacterium]